MALGDLLLQSCRLGDRAACERLVRAGSFSPQRVYEFPDDHLSLGPSFGNDKCWVRMLATGAIESLFAVDVGMRVCGSLQIRYGDSDHHFYLRPSSTGSVQLHPGHHRHEFELPGSIVVREITFVPHTPAEDPPVAIVIVDITNESNRTKRIDCFGFCDLSGHTEHDMQGRWDDEMNAVVAHNLSSPNWVRAFGATGQGVRHMTSRDFNLTLREAGVEELTNETSETGDVLGVLQVPVLLRAQESHQFAFILAFSPGGEAGVREVIGQHLDFHQAFGETLQHYESMTSLSDVMTPDPVINRGAHWSKVNMLRVQAHYPKEWGFTNDPGLSQNIVGRDVVWFVYGSDWMTPEFSRRALMAFARLQTPEGKIIEYYNGQTGYTDDYGLNINDNTPLFILGARHHHFVTGDREFLEEVYPHVARAARYILAQENGVGLVFCTSRERGARGIAGWRNIIDGTSISGSVTEINSECYAALSAAAELAARMGIEEDERTFSEEARKLKSAINKHLLNPDSGLYYLNIDVDGIPHPEMSGDLVFPVMFGVAPPRTAFRIVSRLNAPDFWTESGLRTVSRESPLYNPTAHAGLLGGVWPGLSFWYAFSAAEYHPEFMARMLHNSYAQYEVDPRKNRTVPGEYAEWFDGESFTNGGMKLSPWEPPRYLWAAVEGACGIDFSQETLRIRPRMPAYWKWLGVRRLPFRGRLIAMYVARMGDHIRIHCDHEFTAPHPRDEWDRDVSDLVQAVEPHAHVIAFGRRDEHFIAVNNSSRQSINVALTMSELFRDPQRLHVRIYDSEQGEWSVEFDCEAAEMERFVVRVESEGFRLIETRPI